MFYELCSFSALSYSFEFLVVVVVPSDYFVSVMVVLLLGLCLLLGCDNNANKLA